MLSSKVSGPGLMSTAVGIDRGRVGERLQAALAGLHELQYLKEKQSDMVIWALRMDREDPVCSTQTNDPMPGPEEQCLEATLAALKQQLSRLQRQDVGLKTHLQELDQQISELKLDVCKVSSELQESDSRPSSGFYDLSDGGSCSLSNSCTSVYSECLSYTSHTSLLSPPSHIARPYPLSSSMQAEPSRRRSADETTTQPNPPRGTGLHLGSSRIRTGTASSERARQRPVSTGDLDRMLTPGVSYYRWTDVKKPSLHPTLRTSTVDPKFQNNLVSCSGAEVYCYPSPLHAVALQSPIFTLGGEPATTAGSEGQEPPVVVISSTKSLQQGQEVVMSRPQGYIDKMLQRSMSKINFQRETGRESVCRHSNLGSPSEASADGAICPGNPLILGLPPQSAILSDVPSCDRKRQSGMYPNQEGNSNPTQRQIVQENTYHYSHPAAMREHNPAEGTASKTCIKAQSGDVKDRAFLDQECVAAPGRNVSELRATDRRLCVSHSSCSEEGRGFEYSPGHAKPSSDFVHARFVPAGSQCVKVRQADRKTKAVKLRRREKPRAGRPQLGCYSSEGSREGHWGGAQVEKEQRGAGKGRASHRVASCLVEELRCTGSEACFSGPELSNNLQFCSHQFPQRIVANKVNRGRRAQSLDLVQPSEPRKRWQGPANMGMLQAMCVQGQKSRDLVIRSSLSCSFSSRPHSGHWEGDTPRALQPLLSPSSYFTSSFNGRYPPSPFPVSTPYLPRCESEYSAECASLFHSTIAESSEGEVSDNTINRFGDSESSQSCQSPSDSDSSLSLDEVEHMEGYEEERGLVWAKAALGPTAAGLPLRQLPHAEPPACRIKASRALKKKIRRFQPASLKVMTLV